jgi:hypothetical protein
MKNLLCEIIIPLVDRRRNNALAGKIAVSLISLKAFGPEVATWYLLSQGVSPEMALRVLSEPSRRRQPASR